VGHAGHGRSSFLKNQIWTFESPTKANIWAFPKIGVPENGWFIMENPIKKDDLGVPLFSETSIFIHGWSFNRNYGLRNSDLSTKKKSPKTLEVEDITAEISSLPGFCRASKACKRYLLKVSKEKQTTCWGPDTV